MTLLDTMIRALTEYRKRNGYTRNIKLCAKCGASECCRRTVDGKYCRDHLKLHYT